MLQLFCCARRDPYKGGENMAENKNDVDVIRRFILEQAEPFTKYGLFYRAEKDGITDRGLIMIVLDELYQEGLVQDGIIGKTSDGKDLCGFFIDA